MPEGTPYYRPVAPEVPVADNTAAKIIAGTDLTGAFFEGLKSFSQITQHRQQQEIELQRLAQETKLREEGFALTKQRLNDDYELKSQMFPILSNLRQAQTQEALAKANAAAGVVTGVLQNTTNVANEFKSFNDEWNASGLNDSNPKNPVKTWKEFRDISERYQNFDYKPAKDMIAAKQKQLEQTKIPILHYGGDFNPTTNKWEGGEIKNVTPGEIMEQLNDPNQNEVMVKALQANKYADILAPVVTTNEAGTKTTVSDYKKGPVLQSWIDQSKGLKFGEHQAARVPVSVLSKNMAAATQSQAVAPAATKVKVRRKSDGQVGFMSPAAAAAHAGTYETIGPVPAATPAPVTMSPATVQAVEDNGGSTDASGDGTDGAENFADGGRVGERQHFADGGRPGWKYIDGVGWVPESTAASVPVSADTARAQAQVIAQDMPFTDNSLPPPADMSPGPGGTNQSISSPSGISGVGDTVGGMYLQQMSNPDAPVVPTAENYYQNWMNSPDAPVSPTPVTNYQTQMSSPDAPVAPTTVTNFQDQMSNPDTAVSPAPVTVYQNQMSNPDAGGFTPAPTMDFTGGTSPVFTNPDYFGTAPTPVTNFQGQMTSPDTLVSPSPVTIYDQGQMSNPDAVGTVSSPVTAYDQGQMSNPDATGVTPSAVTSYQDQMSNPDSNLVVPGAVTNFDAGQMSNPDATPTVPTATTDYTGGADTVVSTPTDQSGSAVSTPATDAAIAAQPTVMAAEPSGPFLGAAMPIGTPDPGYVGYGQSAMSSADLFEMGNQQFGGATNSSARDRELHPSFGIGVPIAGQMVDGEVMHVPRSSLQDYHNWVVAHNPPGTQNNRPAQPSAASRRPPGVRVSTGARMPGPPSTSDKIPAWLSNGEVVINSAAVQLLDRMHGKGWEKKINAMGMRHGRN